MSQKEKVKHQMITHVKPKKPKQTKTQRRRDQISWLGDKPALGASGPPCSTDIPETERTTGAAKQVETSRELSSRGRNRCDKQKTVSKTVRFNPALSGITLKVIRVNRLKDRDGQMREGSKTQPCHLPETHLKYEHIDS